MANFLVAETTSKATPSGCGGGSTPTNQPFGDGSWPYGGGSVGLGVVLATPFGSEPPPSSLGGGSPPPFWPDGGGHGQKGWLATPQMVKQTFFLNFFY
jgi:hypothetical protein